MVSEGKELATRAKKERRAAWAEMGGEIDRGWEPRWEMVVRRERRVRSARKGSGGEVEVEEEEEEGGEEEEEDGAGR